MLSILSQRSVHRANGVRTLTNKAWLRGRIAPNALNRGLLLRFDAEIANATESPGRMRILKDAATILLGVEQPIKNIEDLRSFVGSGPSFNVVYDAVKDALLDVTQERRKELVVEYCKLTGIGVKKANEFVDAGFRSLDEVAAFIGRSRSKRQQLRVKDVQTSKNITDKQAGLVTELVREAYDTDAFDIHLVGCHRRRLKSGHEVKLLMVHKDAEEQLIAARSEGQLTRRSGSRDAFCMRLQHRIFWPLQSRAYIADIRRVRARYWVCLFRIPEQSEERSERAQRLQERTGMHVMLEVHSVQLDAAGAALIFLTGDASFLRMMRTAATQRGLELTKHGLYRRCSPDELTAQERSDVLAARTTTPTVKLADDDTVFWRLIPTRSERAVFEELGVEWVAPTRRNFTNIFPGGPTANKRTTRRKVRASDPELSSDLSI